MFEKPRTFTRWFVRIPPAGANFQRTEVEVPRQKDRGEPYKVESTADNNHGQPTQMVEGEHRLDPSAVGKRQRIPGDRLPRSSSADLRCSNERGNTAGHRGKQPHRSYDAERETDGENGDEARDRAGAESTLGALRGEKEEYERGEIGQPERRRRDRPGRTRADPLTVNEVGGKRCDGHEARKEEAGVRNEMKGRVHFLRERNPRTPDSRQQLSRDLRHALAPPILLCLEGANVERQLGRDDDVGPVDEAPPVELGSIAQVEVFRERIGLPPARPADRVESPNARRAVEIEEATRSGSRNVFDPKVRVQEHGLRPAE